MATSTARSSACRFCNAHPYSSGLISAFFFIGFIGEERSEERPLDSFTFRAVFPCGVEQGYGHQQGGYQGGGYHSQGGYEDRHHMHQQTGNRRWGSQEPTPKRNR